MRLLNCIIRSVGKNWLLCLVLSFGIISGCEEKTEYAEVSSVPVREPDQHFLMSRMVITENGITSAIVEADTVDVYADNDFTSIDGGIVMEFFDKKGEQTSTLTADHGGVWGLYEEVDSLKATGNVVIVSVDSTKRMETASSLTWISETRKIYADSLVRLATESGIEQGINFEANEDLSEYRMDNVSGEIEGSEFNLPGN